MKNQKSQQTDQTKAKAKVEFRIHLINYTVINTLLAIINLTLTPEYIWFKWPLLGWGIGIITHGINVHFSTNSRLKEQMIKKEIEKQTKPSTMKTISLIIFLSVLLTNIHAQETESLIADDQQSETSYSGFGGPLFSATNLNHEIGLCIGGKGGTVVNGKFSFGGIGLTVINPLEFTDNNLSDNLNSPLEMSYGAGGVFFEYIFSSRDLIQFSIPVNLMAGGINIYERDTEIEIETSAFFIIEPGINIDIKISDSYTQSLFTTYRQAIGSSLTNLEDKNISGLNVGLMFMFGR